MNAIEALTKIRVMLGMEAEAEVKSVEFAEATLVDGTVVKVDGELAEGKSLFVVTEEGDIPAPMGTHETTEGLLVSVDENGVILAIEDKPAEVEQELSEDTETVEAVESSVEANNSLNEELLGQIAGLIAPLQAQIAEIGEKYSTLNAQFSAFKDEPAAERITNNLNISTDAVKGHNARQEQRMETLLKMRKQ